MKNKKQKQNINDKEVIIELLNNADRLQKDLSSLLSEISIFKSDARGILNYLAINKEKELRKDEQEDNSLGFVSYE